MNANVYSVKLGNKRIDFVRTESGRFFDFTGCQPVTDNKYGINYNGLLRGAKQVSDQYVADLVAEANSQAEPQPQSILVKGTSKTKRRRKRNQVKHFQKHEQRKEVYA